MKRLYTDIFVRNVNHHRITGSVRYHIRADLAHRLYTLIRDRVFVHLRNQVE